MAIGQISVAIDDLSAACLPASIHVSSTTLQSLTLRKTHLVVATSTCTVPAEFAQRRMPRRHPLLQVYTNLYWRTKNIKKLDNNGDIIEL